VECAGTGPDAVLDGIRAGRVAISAGRGGPVLLRHGDELIAVDADGLLLTGPDGPRARVAGHRVTFSGLAGYHRLTDLAGTTIALTP
jgi:hypothetical protein